MRLSIRVLWSLVEVALVRLSVRSFRISMVSHVGSGILYGVSSIPRLIFLFSSITFSTDNLRMFLRIAIFVTSEEDT